MTATSWMPTTTPFLMWNPMLDMVCCLSILRFGEVAPNRRTRGVMAFSTTYKHPEGKNVQQKMIFFKKNHSVFVMY